MDLTNCWTNLGSEIFPISGPNQLLPDSFYVKAKQLTTEASQKTRTVYYRSLCFRCAGTILVLIFCAIFVGIDFLVIINSTVYAIIFVAVLQLTATIWAISQVWKLCVGYIQVYSDGMSFPDFSPFSRKRQFASWDSISYIRYVSEYSPPSRNNHRRRRPETRTAKYRFYTHSKEMLGEMYFGTIGLNFVLEAAANHDIPLLLETQPAPTDSFVDELMV